MHRLGCQTHMTTDGNAAFGQQLDCIGQPFAAFQFNHLCAGLHQYRRIIQCLRFSGIRHKRHISNQQGVLIAALNRFSVVGHLVHCHWYGAVAALNNIAQRIADQNHLNSGLFNQC